MVMCYAWHMIEHVCQGCASPFTSRKSTSRFCTHDCFYAWKRGHRDLAECARCGVQFEVRNRAYLRRGKAKFCSRTCSSRRAEVDITYFKNLDPESAYWLGLLFADGHVTHRAFTISLKESDGAILLGHMCQDMKSTHKLALRRGFANVQVSSPELASTLNSWGCVYGKKSDKILYPAVPQELEHHFIRGIFDGDGWMTSDERASMPPYWSWGIHSDSAPFTDAILERLQQAGIHGTTSRSGKGKTVKVSGRDQFPVLQQYLYQGATRWMNRKRVLIDEAVTQEQGRPPRATVNWLHTAGLEWKFRIARGTSPAEIALATGWPLRAAQKLVAYVRALG